MRALLSVDGDDRQVALLAADALRFATGFAPRFPFLQNFSRKKCGRWMLADDDLGVDAQSAVAARFSIPGRRRSPPCGYAQRHITTAPVPFHPIADAPQPDAGFIRAGSTPAFFHSPGPILPARISTSFWGSERRTEHRILACRNEIIPTSVWPCPRIRRAGPSARCAPVNAAQTLKILARTWSPCMRPLMAFARNEYIQPSICGIGASVTRTRSQRGEEPSSFHFVSRGKLGGCGRRSRSCVGFFGRVPRFRIAASSLVPSPGSSSRRGAFQFGEHRERGRLSVLLSCVPLESRAWISVLPLICRKRNMFIGLKCGGVHECRADGSG